MKALIKRRKKRYFHVPSLSVDMIKSSFLLLVSEKINGDIKLQDKLASSLDRTSHRLIKTWEHLACTKEIDAPLDIRLSCKINSPNSCTLMLFDLMRTDVLQKDKTIKDLIDALTTIGRGDVKKMITEVYKGMFEFVCHLVTHAFV